jgi:hypothetical protein
MYLKQKKIKNSLNLYFSMIKMNLEFIERTKLSRLSSLNIKEQDKHQVTFEVMRSKMQIFI